MNSGVVNSNESSDWRKKELLHNRDKPATVLFWIR